MNELEELSREAAKVLLRDHLDLCREHLIRRDGVAGGLASEPIIYLAESTEACAEIYVRVLMPLRVDLDWIAAGEIYASRRPGYKGTHPSIIIAKVRDANKMQAFRTAVLRALIEVKK
jgi:hypothetical protein